MKSNQAADTILMIRPANFGFNQETAANNVFQEEEKERSSSEVISTAKAEYDAMVLELRSHGVKIISIADTHLPVKTDAVFGNNWMSTHRDGSLYLYPMYSPNRRLERRADIVSRLSLDYQLTLIDDLLSHEEKDQYLESTGSMIIDHDNKLIYACESDRTHRAVLTDFGRRIGHEIIMFDALDKNGLPVYHTNVVMTLGSKVAVICTECIVDEDQRNNVIHHLKSTNKEILDISRQQVNAFAGNMLEVVGSSEKPILVMSQSAYESLSSEQLHIIKNHNKIVSCTIPTIEKLGGGSVRCMMTEIFLPVHQ